MHIKPYQLARISFILVWLILFATTGAVFARDMSGLYSQAELERWQGIYSPNVRSIFFQDIGRYLESDELKTLSTVRLNLPIYSSNRQIFDFSAYNNIIETPILSIKFFDDLAIAFSWLDRNNCQKEAVSDYIAMLYDEEHALPKAPLRAFPIPADVLKDPWIDDVSQKILKSAVTFLLLHEFGHIHLRHQDYDEISRAEAQAQEADADRFALDVMRRMRLPPLGIALWFTAASLLDPSQASQHKSTHPVTGERLNAFAAQLRRQPGDFIEPANRGVLTEQTILSFAQDIGGIGAMLIDDKMRTFKRLRGKVLPVEHLQLACQPDSYDRETNNYLKHYLGLVGDSPN